MTTEMGGDLTIAELVRMVERLGADPETTIFNTGYGPVQVGEIELVRTDGILVVDMTWDDDEDEDDWDSLASVTGVAEVTDARS